MAKKKQNKSNPTILSLFAGSGGMDLGFINAGFDIVWANDFEEDCVKTYKKNIDDARESPAFSFFKILKNKNIIVDYHDPYIKKIKTRKVKKAIKSVNLKNIKKYDTVFLLTDHDCFNYKYIKRNSNFIVDTRNVFKKDIKGKLLKL